MRRRREGKLFLYGPIYTGGEEGRWVEAVVVNKKGRIVYVGDKEGAQKHFRPSSQVLTLPTLSIQTIGSKGEEDKAIAIPAFHDAHVHPFTAAKMDLTCNISTANSLQHGLEMIRKYAKDNPTEKWITGMGWQFHWFPPNGCCLASALEEAVKDRPCVLRSFDGHSMWANTLAMEAAGVYSPSFPDPPHGTIDRDERGFPLGCFREKATDLFRQFLPQLSEEDVLRAMDIATHKLLRVGIVGFQDALVRGSTITAYEKASKQPQRYPLKASLSIWWNFQRAQKRIETRECCGGSGDMSGHNNNNNNETQKRSLSYEFRLKDREYTLEEEVEEQIEFMKAIRDKQQKEIEQAPKGSVTPYRWNTIKLMLDGVMESHTAYLSEPYIETEGGGDNRGICNYPRDYLTAVVKALDREGFQVHCHALGDQAITDALDAIEEAIKQRKGEEDFNRIERRHHLAHLQVVHPRDVPRFGQLDVTANIQPLWMVGDENMLDCAVPTLGEERNGWQYPIRSIMESQGRICFGSDWFVGALDPLFGIEAAVTHTLPSSLPLHSPESETIEKEEKQEKEENKKKKGGKYRQPWNAGQCISVKDAVKFYTLNSAWMSFLENDSGSIEVGKAGDIVILSRNIFEVDPSLIHSTTVLLTIVDGVLAYIHPSLSLQ